MSKMLACVELQLESEKTFFTRYIILPDLFFCLHDLLDDTSNDDPDLTGSGFFCSSSNLTLNASFCRSTARRSGLLCMKKYDEGITIIKQEQVLVCV